MRNNCDAMFSNAAALHQAGRLDAAMPIYRSVLAIDPRHANTLHALGLLHMQCGNWEEGIQIARRFLKIHPDHPDVLNNLGYALHKLNHNEEALGCFDRVVRLHPAYAAAWYNRGNLLQDMRRYEDAVSSYQQALRVRPGHADTWNNLGKAYKLMERYDEARACYVQAISLAPNNAVAHNNLGNTLYELKRHQEALASLDRAIVLSPDYADAYFNAALILQELRRYDEALANYDRAIALNPDNPKPHTCKGNLLIELGRMGEAENTLDKVARMESGGAAPLVALLSLKGRYREDDPHFRQLEALYAGREDLDREDRIFLDFSMGKAYERVGRYDDAFAAYEEGNRLHSLDHPHDEAGDIRFLQSSRTYFSKELFEKSSALERNLPVWQEERVPIFIVGMPRSGTTLLEQVMASHHALYGAGELEVLPELARTVELPPLDSPDWDAALLEMRKLGRAYLDRVWQLKPDARYITDKLPHNFLHLGLIHLMLPGAKIIHSMRDPMDSCFSSYALKFKKGHEYCYDLGTLGRHYLRYQELMEHWHRVLPAGRILDVRYEDNVADLEGQARRVLDYIGLPWDPACLDFHAHAREVRTASVTQVRKPIYSSSVARWKNFEKHLAPLVESVCR